jgi:signal transduction histidine kinase
VNIIIEEVDRMNQLVQDLLDFSRQSELTMAAIDVGSVVSSTLTELAPELGEAGVAVEQRLETGTPRAMASAVKLKQVLMNVFGNAMQAMTPPVAPEGRPKRLSVTVGPVAAGEGRGPGVEIAVTDTGTGMDKTALAKAFEPFYTTRDRGTGLGLAICRKIIQQHGGSIRAESQLGAGTTMRITLPV